VDIRICYGWLGKTDTGIDVFKQEKEINKFDTYFTIMQKLRIIQVVNCPTS